MILQKTEPHAELVEGPLFRKIMLPIKKPNNRLQNSRFELLTFCYSLYIDYSAAAMAGSVFFK